MTDMRTCCRSGRTRGGAAFSSRASRRSASRVADVASGTAAVAIELARAVPERTVTGVDQSAEMLAAGRGRVERAGLGGRIELREGRAEALPFDEGEFDALTFTYLLRYVDDPAATLRGARPRRAAGRRRRDARVRRTAAAIWRPLWELYVRVGLPGAGAVVSRRGETSGASSGRASAASERRYPLESVLDALARGRPRATCARGG